MIQYTGQMAVRAYVGNKAGNGQMLPLLDGYINSGSSCGVIFR